MARKIAAIVFSLGCMHASSLLALGLGELTLDSFLNEPLKARVDLLNTGGLHEDQIKIRLATSEDFKRMGIDRAYFLTSITFKVDMDDNGRARIVLTSTDPVLEPYLDFIVEARWPSGRLLREYTVLVDPPVFDQSSTVISASERVAEVEGKPAPAKKKKPAAASGTRVEVGRSNLGPGEMPQRAFNSNASPTPVPGGRYMIHRDDTLWEIAVSAKPAGASVHQTMLDIQRLNPDAFIDGNINRIKAGFIVYLPGESDISSADRTAAMAAVREQNAAWEQSKSAEPGASSGPSLRISAAPEEADDAAPPQPVAPREVGTSAAVMEDRDKSELERSEMTQRLASMEQQLETLQRIVSVKDDQIAALQNALADEQAVGQAELADKGDVGVAPATGAQGETGAMPTPDQQSAQTPPAATGPEVTKPAVVAAPPAPAAVVKIKTPPAAQTSGVSNYLWYVLGAIVLGIVGFVFMRRRRQDAYGASDTALADDVFADVELQEQPLEVVAEEEGADASEPEHEQEDPEQFPKSTRGYGQRKHDEYASDGEANDALAEADIYIAYGRYPQAIELLKNAIASEPGNPEFRLKLLQLHVDMNDRTAAMKQLQELETIADPASLARGRELLDSIGQAGATNGNSDDTRTHKGETAIAAAQPRNEFEESLQADFNGLEIEPHDDEDSLVEELDLSADFDADELDSEGRGEDLVIAAESNGMSTKLDLARAYMDMGDDDGARQILEEVAAEGSADLQAEALALLERLG